jgi:hypothetical protein
MEAGEPVFFVQFSYPRTEFRIMKNCCTNQGVTVNSSWSGNVLTLQIDAAKPTGDWSKGNGLAALEIDGIGNYNSVSVTRVRRRHRPGPGAGTAEHRPAAGRPRPDGPGGAPQARLTAASLPADGRLVRPFLFSRQDLCYKGRVS